MPQPKGMDKIAWDFVTSSVILEGRGSNESFRLSVFLVALISSAIVFFLSLAFECHMCCNVMFVRGRQRVRERNREIFKVILFIVMALGVYLVTAIPCYYSYEQLHGFNATRAEINQLLREYTGTDNRMWNKIQIWFDCCGMDNYTFWINNTNADIRWYLNGKIVPDSCCRVYKTGCGNFTDVNQIHEQGCLKSVTTHINDQIRYHTEVTQSGFLYAAFILMLVSTSILGWARRKCNSCLRCCPKNGQNVNDRIDDNNHDGNDQEQQNVENNEEHENPDDTIVNIENEDNDNDNDNNNVNDGVVNGAIEMDEIVVVHQNDVDDDQERLLE